MYRTATSGLCEKNRKFVVCLITGRENLIKKKEDFMKRFVLVALMKALVITVGTNLLYVLYGLIFENHFEINLKIEIIFFLVVFFISLIEYVWKNRNLWRE